MKICQYLFYFAFGFWFGRTCKQSKKSKFIILAFLLILIVSRETYADESYRVDGNYVFYTSNVRYDTDMPPLTFYPNIINYTNTVYQNITFQGDTTYQLNEKIVCNSLNELYLGATYLSGSRNAGLDSYTQEYVYLNSESDFYKLHFNITQKRGGSGWVDIYGYYNSTWVKVISETYSNVYSSGDIIPDSKIQGWKIVCHYDLSNRFYMVRTDDLYSDGYLLNEFGFIIKDSQQQEEDTQKSIEENTRQTNGLLGTIKNGIDNIITGITNLPQTILNGIHSLFVPDDIQEDFEDIMDTLHDDLGVLALPIDFIHSVCSTITDTTTTVFPVHTPAFKYDNKTIFPAYDRDNILYFGSLPVFGNVGASSWFDNLMSKVGINRNMTIMQCIQALMKLIIFIGIIRYIYNIVYEYYHMDFDDEVGGADL